VKIKSEIITVITLIVFTEVVEVNHDSVVDICECQHKHWATLLYILCTQTDSHCWYVVWYNYGAH